MKSRPGGDVVLTTRNSIRAQPECLQRRRRTPVPGICIPARTWKRCFAASTGGRFMMTSSPSRSPTCAPVASTSICPSCVTFGRPCYSGQGSTDATLSTRTVAFISKPRWQQSISCAGSPCGTAQSTRFIKAPSQSTPRLKRPGSPPLCIVASPAPAPRNPAFRRTQTRARKSTAGQRHNEIVIGGGHRMTAARRPSVHGGPADRSHRRRA